jgi:DNA-binding NarL/FixJ family response regulator
MRIAQKIELSDQEFKKLTSWPRGRRTPARLMKRANIILLAAEGRQNKAIAEHMKIDRLQVLLLTSKV